MRQEQHNWIGTTPIFNGSTTREKRYKTKPREARELHEIGFLIVLFARREQGEYSINIAPSEKKCIARNRSRKTICNFSYVFLENLYFAVIIGILCFYHYYAITLSS